MGRALALFLFLPLAWGQTVNCDAVDLRYDFSAPGPPLTLTVGGQPYYVANLASYLLLLGGNGPMRFLPTEAVGGSGHRLACTVTTPNRRGRRGGVCGARDDWCLRVTGVSGSLPVDWRARLYVLVQVASGRATSHVTSPTLLDAVPDGRGLASVDRNATATLHLYYWLELWPGDTFPALPAGGTLTLTYELERN
ncbi:hypothetical protein [Thermus sediminis]|uniref:hypothetical protein n=1 Tax=Thermus sediminis TaxID=1761908 RepID=UPI000E3D4EF5|nr:hypothetical protein [Thermus sediminis]